MADRGGVSGLRGLARGAQDRRLQRAAKDLEVASTSADDVRFLVLAEDFARRWPQVEFGHAALAEALQRRGRYEEALRAVDRAVAAGWDERQARMLRADIHGDAGRPAEAIQECSVLVGEGNAEVRQISLLMRSRLLMDLGDHPRALADANEALAALPDAFAYAMRGHVHRVMKHFDACLEDYGRAIRLQPGEPSHLQNRAEVYDELGRDSEARADRAAATTLVVDRQADDASTDARRDAISRRSSPAPLILVLALIVAAVVLLMNGLTAVAGPVLLMATAIVLVGVVQSGRS